MVRFLLPVGLSVLALACAHGAASAEFPSAAQMEALAQQAPPAPAKKDNVVFVDQWELKGPFPQTLEHVLHTATSSWDELLAARVAQKQGTLQATEDMACIAREMGLFFLAKQGRPSDGLSEFIYGRCATAAERVFTTYLSGEVPATVPDEKLFADWKADFEKMLGQSLVGGNRIAGVWFGRHQGRAVAMIATGVRTAAVQPVSLFPQDDGTVRMTGELLINAKHLAGSINQGAYGFADCVPDPQIVLPRFSFRCPVNLKDAHTRIELHVFQSGRLLGNLLLRVLAWPAKSPTNMYQAASREGLVASVGAPAKVFVSLVNQVRKSAGQAPLTLSDAESAMAAKLAPHYFAAIFGAHNDETIADKVVLGVRAGWSVGKPLRDGDFDSSLAPVPGDIASLVVDMLEHPQGRRTLLNPNASVVSFGPLLDDEQKVRAAIIGTYTLMEASHRTELEGKVLARLNKLRAEKGAPPAKLKVLAGNDEAVNALAKGEAARPVMDQLLKRSVTELNRSAQAFWVETNEIDNFEFDEVLLQNEPIEVSLAVGTSQRPSDPWMHYVVMCIVTSPGTGPMAESPARVSDEKALAVFSM